MAEGPPPSLPDPWGNSEDCDVASIEVPTERRWRASPACSEVEPIARPK